MGEIRSSAVVLLNAGATVIANPAVAYLKPDDPAAFYRERDVNTGDVFLADAMVRQFAAREVWGLQLWSPPDPSLWPANPAAVVLRGSNYLSPSFDLGPAIPLLRALPEPLVAAGIGAQAAARGHVELTEGTREAMRIIASKSASIGVRGQFSAEVLDSIGIRNVRVIGCPSVFRSLRPALRIARPDPATARVGITLNRHLWGEYASNGIRARRLQRHLLLEAAARASSRVYHQGEREEALLDHAASEDERDALVAHVLAAHGLGDHAGADRLIRSSRTFLDPAEWVADIAERVDAMVGFRLHGNIAALHQGLPAVLFTYDTRTRELAEHFRMPSVECDSLAPFAIEDLLERADWSAFEGTYRQRYAEFRAFLDENGVPHRLPPPAEPLNTEGMNGHVLTPRVPAERAIAFYRDEAMTMSTELYAAWQAVAEAKAAGGAPPPA